MSEVGTDTPETVPAAHGPRRRARLSGGKRVAIVSVVVVGAIAFLLLRVGEAALYFRTVDEAVAQRDELGDRRFRVQGEVVPGSVEETDDGVSFTIAGDRRTLEIDHQGDPPELFQDEIPVVLEGSFDGTRFASDRILVKHSEQYREQHPDRVAESPEG